MGSILVITSQDDAHLPFVQKHLSDELLVIDPYEIAQGAPLTFGIEGGAPLLNYKGRTIDSVKSIWYRKPGNLKLDELKVKELYRPYAVSAIERHIKMLRTCFDEAFWLSDYYAIQRASSKEMQLRKAQRVGFNVPDTYLTSDALMAKKFIDSHENTIIKSLSSQFPLTEDAFSFFFAKKVTKSQDINLDNLYLAPAIFQQAIDAVLDLRVTVVGQKVFTASIKSGVDSGVRDWRHNYRDGDNIFKPYDLDRATESQCIKLIKILGLNYGAIDLLVDRKGKIWFLENNPNGQWAFVEEDTKLPIGKAIADTLSNVKM